MALFRTHSNLVRPLAAVMAGLSLGACMKWQTQSLQPERFRAADSMQTRASRWRAATRWSCGVP